MGVSATAGCLMNSEGVLSSGMTRPTASVWIFDNDGELTSSYQGQSSRSKNLQKSQPAFQERSTGLKKFKPTSPRQRCARRPRPPDERRVFASVFHGGPSGDDGREMVRNESFWSEKMNTQVINPSLSIRDDGLLEGGMSSGSRDGEGSPTSTSSGRRRPPHQHALGDVETQPSK